MDAGEVGAGHSVTALYEMKLHDDADGVLGTVYLRFEDPDSGVVSEIDREFPRSELAFEFGEASPRFQMAAVVAEYAEILREKATGRRTAAWSGWSPRRAGCSGCIHVTTRTWRSSPLSPHSAEGIQSQPVGGRVSQLVSGSVGGRLSPARGRGRSGDRPLLASESSPLSLRIRATGQNSSRLSSHQGGNGARGGRVSRLLRRHPNLPPARREVRIVRLAAGPGLAYAAALKTGRAAPPGRLPLVWAGAWSAGLGGTGTRTPRRRGGPRFNGGRLCAVRVGAGFSPGSLVPGRDGWQATERSRVGRWQGPTAG